MEKKLIYVLNHYSKNSVQHFFHVINLLEHIAKEGVKIALVIEKCDDEPEIDNSNIKVFCQKETNKLKRAKELSHIIDSLTKDGYDKIYIRISIAATIITCFTAHKNNAKVYYWQSGDAFEFYRSRRFPLNLKWFIKSYIPYYVVKENVDYFVTGPERMLDYYEKSGHVKREKLRLLYNDISTERFSVPASEEKFKIRDKLGLDRNKFYILQVHRFSDYRKTDYYIPYVMKSFRDNECVELLIIGSGGEEEVVKRGIEESGLQNIKMIGSKPNSIIQEYYKAVDLFINPSASEGFPRVVIEAMACGLPVVATGAGGTIDIFSELQKPYVVDVNDRDKMCECINEMYQDEEIRNKCGQANRERVKLYDTENVAKMYIDMIWGEEHGKLGD
jgi:glycosyltransferase involved in cell wall biosynthesis